MNRHRIRYCVAVLAITTLSACATSPEQLNGEFSALNPVDVTPQDLKEQVRWAGFVIDVQPQEDHTCFSVLSVPVDETMRPQSTDTSDGIFIACKAGTLDDVSLDTGVTLTGRIFHIDERQIGDDDVSIPVVEVAFLEIWPENRRTRRPDFVYKHYIGDKAVATYIPVRSYSGPRSYAESIFWASTNH